MTPKTKQALELAKSYFQTYKTVHHKDVLEAICEALAEPAPRRLTNEEIADCWQREPGDFLYGVIREIEARIFGDKP
jgi:ubiquitin-protein ligase